MYVWVFNNILFFFPFPRIDLSNEENCAYLYYHKLEVHSEDCYEKYPWICEKAAVQLI